MKVAREELLAALQLVRPALITNNTQMDRLAHVRFDGEAIQAGSDFIGVSVPFKTDFEGGLRGVQLIALLETVKANEIDLKVDKGNVLIKAGSTSLKLPLLDMDSMIWDFPDQGAKKQFELNKTFLTILKKMLISSGGAGASAEQQGLVFQVTDSDVELGTTDAKSLSFMVIQKPPKMETKRAIVPREFFDHVERLMRDGWLSISKDFAVAENGDGIRIYGRLVNDPKPISFSKIVDSKLTEKDEKAAVKIPDGFGDALERAKILVTDPKVSALMLAVQGNKMNLSCKSQLGELNEDIALSKKHPDTNAMFDPELIKRALDNGTDMVFTSDYGAILDGEYVYVVAPVQK
jgi:DNA polymerase III sliding clamp (beta) subunit (PCNA family)